jgi:hypothetical protein
VIETWVSPPLGVEKTIEHEPAETGVTDTLTGVTAGVGTVTVTMRFPSEEQSSASIIGNSFACADVSFSICEKLGPTLVNESAP